jgi:hypothetical protein
MSLVPKRSFPGWVSGNQVIFLGVGATRESAHRVNIPTDGSVTLDRPAGPSPGLPMDLDPSDRDGVRLLPRITQSKWDDRD